MQTQFSAIICDLDGTLLNADHKLGQFTVSVLRQVAKLGLDIYIATGRNYPDVEQLFKGFLMQSATQEACVLAQKISVVSSNGARVSNLSGDTLSTQYIESGIAQQIMTINQHIPWNDSLLINSYQGDDWYISAEFEFLNDLYADFDYGYQLMDFTDNKGEQCEKIFFQAIENFSQLQAIEAYITQQYGDWVQVTYSAPYYLEVMAKGVDKATALAELAHKKGYRLADCLAFGDGLNDVDMLTQAGKGCLMSNAEPRVLAKLRHLSHIESIGHHQDEAVATYLSAMISI